MTVLIRGSSRAVLAAAALLLGACSASSYCTGVQPYEKAKSVPPLRPAGDLKLPESAAALKIPPPPAKAVAYGETYKDADGDNAVRCLDKPPEMAPVAEARPAAPVPAVPPPAASPTEPKPAETPAAAPAKPG